MKKNVFKKGLSLLLALMTLLCVMPLSMAADGEGSTPKVEIVSFMRGAQTNLRASELLEARVTGYDGNVQELTYEWTSTLGTYLYIYNSHNMYYINGTDGEVEIYNSKIPASNNMAGRSYKDKFSGVGYCWASVYGSNTSGVGEAISDNNAYNGTISVTVKDKDGNIIGTDSHTGKVTSSGFGWWVTYSYSGIVDHKLQSDMDDVTIGLFEGDKRNVKDLLGESAIIHITCVESTVNKGAVKSGHSYISLTQENGDYYITGTKAGTGTSGDATVDLTIEKKQCKFHEYTTASATTTVYVFKKPNTSTTAYTLTLTDNIDNRCEYFINGNKGVRQADGTILFEGLNPNTEYMVEVRAEYKDEQDNTRYTYAYVYDTTLPVYNGTVEVYLDGQYDSETHTAQGTRINIDDVTSYDTLFVKEINSDNFIELAKKENSTGVYTSVLDEGSYQIYYTADESTKIDEQHLTIHSDNRTRYLFYNSVEYTDGGVSLGTDYFTTGSQVNTRQALSKDGYVFVGWEDEAGNLYSADSLLTNGIYAPYVLNAVWIEGIDVYLNITIDHYDEDKLGHYTDDDDRHDLFIDLMSRPEGRTDIDFADVFPVPTIVDWDGKSAFSNELFEVSRYLDEKTDTDETRYTAKAPILANTAPGNEYSVEITKTGYEITKLTSTTDANGDVILSVNLRYDPKNADLTFTVELDEDAKALVAEHPEYEPKEVGVKVLSWYSDDYTNGEHFLEGGDWYHITQHHDTFVTLYMEDGKATGFYPVWMHNNSKTEYYHYRIKVVSYVLKDGTIIYTEDTDNKNVQYITPDERYLATMYVDGGENPDSARTSLEGAYFNDDGTQQGNLLGVISIRTHKVTFDPAGGKFSDNTRDNKTAEKQIEVPDFAPYTPIRDGGYVFDGWYLVDENGNITEDTVQSGDPLFGDITLRARWKEPLTVKGVVSVAGFYILDDDVRVIAPSERTHTVTVYLQKLLPNNYTETIVEQKVRLAYNDMILDDVDKPMGTAGYLFEGVPDDGARYRVLINNHNYTVTYQNEPDSINAETVFDYDKYNTSDFMVELGDTEPLVADVNAYMEYSPINFDLNYKVIATTIGEDFRPDLTELLVLYDDTYHGEHPQDWPVISRMDVGNTYTGDVVELSNDGTGESKSPVCITKPDGHNLYDYAVLLKDYTINGEETQFDSERAPFFVYYNGSARYSAREGLTPEHQTQLLTVELQPKRYRVTFDPNFTQTDDDHIEDFEKYSVLIDGVHAYLTGHIWSFETDISDAIPTREGYKFLGWYDENGDVVTKIGAEVAQDVTLTAKWEKLFKVTFHANNRDVADDIFRVYHEKGNVPEGTLTLNENNTVTSFYDIPEFSYTDNNKYIFKGWYLDEDNDNDSRPISWSDVYSEDTDVYAHWIFTGEVAKDAADTKITGSDIYKGYDLTGVQIRDVKGESAEHYGTAGTGLRFITVLSENVYSQINAITKINEKGAEYGFVVAKTATAESFANGTAGYTIQYKAENVNGVDTTDSYKYVQNLKCSGVPDHRNFNDYRLYTAVITYDGLEGDALASAHGTPITARSYIRYTDANGLLRTYYNNYTGTISYNGCSANFADLAAQLNVSQ